MNDQKMREEFEDYFASSQWTHLGTVPVNRKYLFSRSYSNQQYDTERVDKAWDVWQAACASKQREIDSWKIVAENWRVKAVDWSRKNAELERRLRLIALEEYENPPVEPSEVYSPHVKVIK